MKAIVRYLILGVLLLAVAACGAPAATPAAPEVAAEPTAAPEAEESPTPAPAQTGIVTVGIDPSFEPFVFAKDGKLSGFDVDLLNAMAADGDFEVAYVVSDFDEIFAGLQSGKYDAAISAITITDARKEIVDFTEPYFESGNAPVSFYNPGQGIAIRTDNTAITGPESLTEGVRVGVKSGTTGAEFAAENTTAELVEFVESKPALDALTAGEVDAVIVDIPVIVGYIKSNPNAGLRVTGGPVTEEAYGIAVSKDKPEVLAKLNEALARVRGSDQYATLFNTWFGTP
ncbi:MAG: transporter substrate-binding domain-containing protein [Caldilinea sp.]|nr:transporter substrate-binding domain-containing protein [Caldilineaceae bacterium]MCB9122705.1 transporter substrate-binding domain-containing protein [Caldilineaceae bacterium]MCB9124803.1 transporter substrate-binding domain-containing protein [Caldilineaceae bacterium]MCO5209670.1 transporter substrate-binding domain-containing protein [Caldilinea sp.]MCW5843933.1 transporter substrate-binding domain-containing protein [Caldilinea sp.]